MKVYERLSGETLSLKLEQTGHPFCYSIECDGGVYARPCTHRTSQMVMKTNGRRTAAELPKETDWRAGHDRRQATFVVWEAGMVGVAELAHGGDGREEAGVDEAAGECSDDGNQLIQECSCAEKRRQEGGGGCEARPLVTMAYAVNRNDWEATNHESRCTTRLSSCSMRARTTL